MSILNQYALATPEELKLFKGGELGSGVDPSYEAALNTASAIVENYLGRDIVTRGTITEYHTFKSYSQDLLLLEWPVISVTNVWEDVARAYGSALTVDTDYIVSKPHAQLIRISGANGAPMSWAIGFRAVKVSYSAGYAVGDVPGHIKDVVLWIAAHLFSESERKSWDVSSQSDGLGTVTRFTLSRLPDYMKAQLVSERRIYPLGVTGERDA